MVGIATCIMIIGIIVIEMASNMDYIKQRKVAVILAVIIIVVGAILYFSTDAYRKGNMSTTAITYDQLELLRNVQLKVAYSEEGSIDIFALARNNDLAKLSSTQGSTIPEIGGMVLGNTEGSMMRKEGEFKDIGDKITDYDISFTIEGILAKTGTFADDFHFINVEEYKQLNGFENQLLVKFKDTKTPKLFYLYDKNNPTPAKIDLSEGNINLYHEYLIDKKIYYPIILGYDEAKMMREEKLFSNTGDTIKGFFGKDVIVIGVLKKTDSGMDMMHIVEPDFFVEISKGSLV